MQPALQCKIFKETEREDKEKAILWTQGGGRGRERVRGKLSLFLEWNSCFIWVLLDTRLPCVGDFKALPWK